MAIPDVVEVRQHNDLHAKVFLSSTDCVVGSANASANGLGREGTDNDGWLEAGCRVAVKGPVQTWFDNTWNSASDIDEVDLEKAQIAWQKRQDLDLKLSNRKFGDFVINVDDYPLITSYYAITIKPVHSSENQFHSGSALDHPAELIAKGFAIDHPDEDAAEFRRGRWVLEFGWRPLSLKRSLVPTFWRVGDIAKRAGVIERSTDLVTVVMPHPNQKGAPFDSNDKAFQAAFEDVINRQEFAALWFDDDSQVRYCDHRQLTLRFWQALVEHRDEAGHAVVAA